MIIDRQAYHQDRVVPFPGLQRVCLGCQNCNGACHELMQMSFLPDILLKQREEQN